MNRLKIISLFFAFTSLLTSYAKGQDSQKPVSRQTDKSNPVDSSLMNGFNGTYQKELWNYIAPLTGRRTKKDSSYHVRLTILTQFAMKAELIRNDSVFSRRIIKGKQKAGKFLVRRKFILIPVPFFFFYYYSGKMNWSLSSEKDLQANIRECIFVEVVLTQGIRNKEEKTFKRLR